MSSIVPLAMIQWNQNIISYFRKKKAFSLETAIPFNIDDFKKVSSNSFLIPPPTVIKQAFIKTDNNGKFYLDENELKIHSTKWLKIGLIMVILSIFLLVFLYITFANR